MSCRVVSCHIFLGLIEGIEKDLWAFDVEVVAVPEIKDYIGDDGQNNIENGLHVDVGEKKKEKTYEDYLKEKEAKEKNLTESEKELVKENNEKEWDDLDKKENADEKDNDGDSESSGDTNK